MPKREWIYLTADRSEAICIKSAGAAWKFLDKLEQNVLPNHVSALDWSDLIVDWKGFYDIEGTLIPCTLNAFFAFAEIQPSILANLIPHIKKHIQYVPIKERISRDLFDFEASTTFKKIEKLAEINKDLSPEVYTAVLCCMEEIRKMISSGDVPSADIFKEGIQLARKAKLYDLELALSQALNALLNVEAKHRKGQGRTYMQKYHNRYLVLTSRIPRIKEHMAQKKEKEATKTLIKTKEKKSSTPSKAGPKNNSKLEKQCFDLGIPIIHADLAYNETAKAYSESYEKKVEFAVAYHLKKEGFEVIPYEGHSLMMIMQAACLDYLKHLDSNRPGVIPDGWNLPARTFSTQVTMYGAQKSQLL